MPNLAKVFKEEIVRLSRRSARVEVESTKKSVSRHQRDIAELKRLIQTLKRQLADVQRVQARGPNGSATETWTPRTRFSAKGVRTQRERIDMSAAEYAKLVGVSAQTIYNWERGTTRPSPDQITKLAALRGLGKRRAHALLAAAT